MLKLKIRVLLGTMIIGLSATAAIVFAQDGRPVEKPGPRDPIRNSPAQADPASNSKDGLPIVANPNQTSAPDHFRATSKDGLPFVPNPNQKFAPGEKPEDTGRIDPFRAVGQPMTVLDAPLAPPGEKEVIEALVKQRYPDLRFRMQMIGTTVDPVKDYPLAGRCQLVHTHYKAIICYTEEGGPVRGREEVLYLDRDYLRRAPNDTTTKSETTSQFASDPTGQPERPFSTKVDRQSETERRLDDVERKLDRILKALEKDAVPQPKGGSGRDQGASTKQAF